MCSFINDLNNTPFNSSLDLINASNKFGLANGLLTNETIFVPSNEQKASISTQQLNKNAPKYKYFSLNTNTK